MNLKWLLENPWAVLAALALGYRVWQFLRKAAALRADAAVEPPAPAPAAARQGAGGAGGEASELTLADLFRQLGLDLDPETAEALGGYEATAGDAPPGRPPAAPHTALGQPPPPVLPVSPSPPPVFEVAAAEPLWAPPPPTAPAAGEAPAAPALSPRPTAVAQALRDAVFLRAALDPRRS